MMQGSTKFKKNLVWCGTVLFATFAYVKGTPLLPPNFGGNSVRNVLFVPQRPADCEDIKIETDGDELNKILHTRRKAVGCVCVYVPKCVRARALSRTRQFVT